MLLMTRKMSMVSDAIKKRECQLLHQSCPFQQLSKRKSTSQQLKLMADRMQRSCSASIEIPSERSAVAAGARARILHPLAME
jgi:hypothetical protein